MKRIRILSPGEILLTEFIHPNNLSVYRVAKNSGISQHTLQMIVTGKRSITAETVLRPGLYFSIDAQFWLNLQSDHDLRLAKKKNLSQTQNEVHLLAA
ncbi:MAG: plasmid maintenance system antidote protein family [Verrucomicrobiales bacterium]|nr:plasmid maintenance system antidote protein family [Verrucomicrobiales bacterium]